MVYVAIPILAMIWLICNNHMQAVAKLGDGSPATSVGVRVIASINNEKQLLHDNVITSTDEDGLVTASIEIPTNAKCLKLTVSFTLT